MEGNASSFPIMEDGSFKKKLCLLHWNPTGGKSTREVGCQEGLGVIKEFHEKDIALDYSL
jgi:hypothetical protein